MYNLVAVVKNTAKSITKKTVVGLYTTGKDAINALDSCKNTCFENIEQRFYLENTNGYIVKSKP